MRFFNSTDKRTFSLTMITTRLSTRSFQSIMTDETLGDDLSTLNQNSSSSILYRALNIQYITQKYIIRSK